MEVVASTADGRYDVTFFLDPSEWVIVEDTPVCLLFENKRTELRLQSEERTRPPLPLRLPGEDVGDEDVATLDDHFMAGRRCEHVLLTTDLSLVVDSVSEPVRIASSSSPPCPLALLRCDDAPSTPTPDEEDG